MIGVGPLALSVQSVASAVPPPVLSSDFVSVRWAGLGGMKVLVMVQVALIPAPSTRLAPVSVPALQDQCPAV